MKTRLDRPQAARSDRLIHEHVHDPYKTKSKLPEPSYCPVCQAVYKSGRWQWAESRPADAQPAICQACHRTKDNYPAGVVILTGPFLRARKEEILSLARHHEKEENAEHPLHRIMKVEEQPDSLIISTTDIHLPQRIGEAVRQAHEGELAIHYDQEGYFVRVTWKSAD